LEKIEKNNIIKKYYLFFSNANQNERKGLKKEEKK
jgi:hypothetical protein